MILPLHINAEEKGESPVLDWLKELRRSNVRAFVACRSRVLLLAAMGHQLRGPHSDLLRDGIYKLRAMRRARELPAPLLLPR